MPLKASYKKDFLILILGLLAGLTTLPFTSFSFAREPIRTVTGTITNTRIHLTQPATTGGVGAMIELSTYVFCT